MKTLKYLIVLIITVTSLSSCNTSTSKESSKVAYQCPMKCEGDKVYLEQGTCPVCKMDLKPTSKMVKKVLWKKPTTTFQGEISISFFLIYF